jgi:hypothetical protein
LIDAASIRMAENLLAKLEQIEARELQTGGPASQPARLPRYAVSSASSTRPQPPQPAAAPEPAPGAIA